MLCLFSKTVYETLPESSTEGSHLRVTDVCVTLSTVTAGAVGGERSTFADAVLVNVDASKAVYPSTVVRGLLAADTTRLSEGECAASTMAFLQAALNGDAPDESSPVDARLGAAGS